MAVHRIRPRLLEDQVHVTVVGCGATGSAIVAGLPYLHQSLLAFGHPGGLQVTVIDGDTVSPANCVRQPFSESDIGLSKAVVLVTRVNTFWGLNWDGVPDYVKPYDPFVGSQHIVIGCVDTRAARRAIQSAIGESAVLYWLDLGNNESDGQLVIGEPLSGFNRDTRGRLPTIADLYPELVDPTLDDDALPSCSAAEALTRQAPFINQVLANHALSLLAQFFRTGQLTHHGMFIDPRAGQARPIPVPDRAALTAADVKDLRRVWKSRAWDFETAGDAFDLQRDELAAFTEDHWRTR